MSNYVRTAELAEEIKGLNSDDRMYLLAEIFKDDQVSATELLYSKMASLEKFKLDAKNDIRMVATAGMELGEREMRRVLKTKDNTRKKTDSFYLSMVRSLLDAGAHQGTQFADELEKSDFSPIDRKWYEECWQPRTTRNK